MMTKDDILQVAIPMLYQRGILCFSLNEFLQIHHISKGSFYHFFNDKDTLVYEALCKDNQNYRYKTEKELYTLKSLESKMCKIFEAYCVDNAYNRQLCKFYQDMFLYAITSQNTLFMRYIQNLKEHTHYLILQSIESTQISKAKKGKMRDLSEFLSLGVDGFWLLQSVMGKTWEEKNAEIKHLIQSLCVFVRQKDSKI